VCRMIGSWHEVRVLTVSVCAGLESALKSFPGCALLAAGQLSRLCAYNHQHHRRFAALLVCPTVLALHSSLFVLLNPKALCVLLVSQGIRQPLHPPHVAPEASTDPLFIMVQPTAVCGVCVTISLWDVLYPGAWLPSHRPATVLQANSQLCHCNWTDFGWFMWTRFLLLAHSRALPLQPGLCVALLGGFPKWHCRLLAAKEAGFIEKMAYMVFADVCMNLTCMCEKTYTRSTVCVFL
jgi:hypothetical protein